ncbi:MAG: glycosyltransferase family 4 protein [Pseudomonadales bacterium]
MRILFVISSLGVGGAERVASTLVNAWAKEENDVGLMTLAGEDAGYYRIDSRVQRIELNLLWPSSNPVHGLLSNIRRIRLLRSRITNFNPEVIVSFIDATNILVLIAAARLKIPTIVSERVDPRVHRISNLRSLMRRIVYPHASALVVQTRAVTAWAQGWMPESKTWVIPNPVPEVPSLDDGKRERIILAAGRLVRQKGFDLLLRSFAKSEARSKGWRLVILGEGPERDSLQLLADELNLNQSLEMQGISSEPWTWMRRAEIFTLPSRYEGFPNVLLEAMAMGCACIATDCPSGPAELIDHDINGLLIGSDDVAALTGALDQMIACPIKRERLGLSAQQVRTTYGLPVVMGEWQYLLRAVSEK